MKDSKDIFYVYAYLDPRKPGDWSFGDLELGYEPFYIGKGQKNRLNSHLREAKNDSFIDRHNPEKTERIRDILEEGSKPIIIKLLQDLDENTSLRIERNVIKLFGRKDKGLGPLLNLTDGGEGSSGYVMSEKQKKQISERLKGKGLGQDNYFCKWLKTATEEQISEWKKKLSKKAKEQYKNGRIHPLLGIGHSKETKEKMRQIKLERGFTENDREGQKKRVKSMIERGLTVGVRQLDLEGNVLNIFPSACEASRKLDIPKGTIFKSMNKGNMVYKKYKFERLNYSTKRITD